VLSTTSFISRRFGLVGGLGVVALLAATEVFFKSMSLKYESMSLKYGL